MKHRQKRTCWTAASTVMLVTFTAFTFLINGCRHQPSRENPDKLIPSVPNTALDSVLLQGDELHPSIQIQPRDGISDLPTGMVLPRNPHLSSDKNFVDATARGGSQGRLDGAGMRSALYARYISGDCAMGFYGLEAESDEVADHRERALREIWNHNTSLNRTHVYRMDKVLLVVWIWTDGELPECWEIVKTGVQQRLKSFEK